MLIFNIITFANLLLLFCLLYFRKNNALPNKILALILINPGINFISNVNILSGNFFNSPYIYFFAQITCFAFAPLVHMYMNLMMGKKINLKHPLYIVTYIFMLMVIGFAIEFSFMSNQEQLIYLNGILKEPYPLQMDITNGFFIIMQQIYFTVAAVQLYKYRKKLPNVFSNYDKTLIAYITRFIILIWILNIITIVLYATLPTTQVEYIYLPLVLTIIYFFILYYSFHYQSIFTHQSYIKFVIGNSLAGYKKMIPEVDMSPAIDDETIFLSKHVEDYIDKEEPFMNPDLTLELLAKEINIPAHKLSIVINKGLNKKFYDLINEKRIYKSKILLKEKCDLNTIEYVAYESGFNSRASFYRAFKKHTNITPKEYLKLNAA